MGKNYSRRKFIELGTFASLAIPFASPASNKFYSQRGNNRSMRFLFQGDSITDGNRGRDKDPNHVMGHGYAFSIASRVGADFPERNVEFFNRGISGNKITDLQMRWHQDTLDVKPDVLSILIGINDTNSVVAQQNAVTAEQYEEVYRSLLKKTIEMLPEVVLVFCEPFIMPGTRVKENWNLWQSDVKKRQEIVRTLAGEYNGIFVGLQHVFEAASKKATGDYWIWDGIHPTVAGHELIAREWLKATSKKLSFLSRYSK